jgi:flavin reductase (DIM6/NTAB) family NADH-FMN oxidoreductase RutF
MIHIIEKDRIWKPKILRIGGNMKEEIPISKANRLINHGSVILVTSHFEGKSNIITLAWQMPVSHSPMLAAISIAKTHYSHEMIKNSGEFVINVPNLDLLSQVHYCGSISGRKADKFEQSKLTPVPAQRVKPPLISECIGHIECKVQNVYPAGDHSIFIGKVLAASVEPGLFDGFWKPDDPKAKTLHHLGGNLYTTPDKRIKAE